MGPAEQAAHQLSQSISRKMSGPISDAMDMLADAESVAVICHIHPDADAIGAASAMVMALRQRGIRAVASYGEDSLPAKSLLTIPGWENFMPYDEIPGHVDTWIAVDAASPQRLGALAPRMMAASRLINVDHHDSNTMYGTINMVDEAAESSTMVLLDFFEVWGIKLTRDMAHALYAGLLTDTVSFQFGRSRMHTAAARLLNKGLDPRTIGAQLLEVELEHVEAAQEDRARLGFHGPGEKRGQRRLARTGAAHQRARRGRRNMEVDVLEREGAGLVGEVQVAELEGEITVGQRRAA